MAWKIWKTAVEVLAVISAAGILCILPVCNWAEFRTECLLLAFASVSVLAVSAVGLFSKEVQ